MGMYLKGNQGNHAGFTKETFPKINWLVVGPPPWKIWKSIGMIIPNIWENKKWQPNHQPVKNSGNHEGKFGKIYVCQKIIVSYKVLVFTQARIGKYKGCGVLTQLFDFVLAKQKFADLMVLSNMIDVLGKWLCFSNDQDNTIDKTIYQNLKCIQFSTLRWKTQSHYGQTMCCSIVSVCCRLFDLHATCEPLATPPLLPALVEIFVSPKEPSARCLSMMGTMVIEDSNQTQVHRYSYHDCMQILTNVTCNHQKLNRKIVPNIEY